MELPSGVSPKLKVTAKFHSPSDGFRAKSFA